MLNKDICGRTISSIVAKKHNCIRDHALDKGLLPFTAL